MEIHKCDKCNQILSNKQALERHLNNKLKCNKITLYKCNNCSKCFAQKKNLTQHTENNRCKNIIPLPPLIEPSQKQTSKYDDIKNILKLSVPIENKYELIKMINNELKLEKLVDILNYELPLETTISLIVKAKRNHLENYEEEPIKNPQFINEKVDYIYLIQERENYEQNKNVYKFGKTSQYADNKIERFKAYKKGSQILISIRCRKNLTETENKIREEFKKEFISHSDGHEHFEGDPDKMIEMICSIVNKN